MSSRRDIPAKLDGHVVTVGWDNPLQTYFAQVENLRAPEEESMVLWLGGRPREHPTPETMVDTLRPYVDLGPDMLKTLIADRAADLNREPSPLQRSMVDVVSRTEPDREPAATAATADPVRGPAHTGPAPAPDGRTEQAPAGRPTPSPDPIEALVAEMQTAAMGLVRDDERLKQAVTAIANQAQDPSRIQEPSFRTAVAYAVQDFQKYTGETLTVDSDLAKEMAARAVTSPGLTEPRLQALMAQTPSLDDRELVRNIRRLAQDSVNGTAQQGGEELNAKLDSLENRARIAQPARVDGAPAATQTAPRNEDPPAARPTASSTSRSGGPGAAAQPRPAADRFIEVPARPGRSDVLVDLVRKMRLPVPSRAEAQMSPPAYSVDQRASLFEKRMAEGKTNGLIGSAERSGVAALDAVERFVTGPGRGILGNMQAAASTEPGGMETVMKEMRSGGRYSDLRTEFDNAYQQDKIFAGAYDKMVDSAGRFGRDRLAVEANFTARGLDPKQLDGRFKQADEAISEATTKVPGRTPGKSMMEELAETVAELFKRAYEGVKRMLGQEAVSAHSPSPSVSM